MCKERLGPNIRYSIGRPPPTSKTVKVSDSWQALGLDFISPESETNNGNRCILTLTDLFSKFVYVEALPSLDVEGVALSIYNAFATYGPPQRILTDQSQEFIENVGTI